MNIKTALFVVALTPAAAFAGTCALENGQVNVQDCGAVGDGKTDDTAALLDAVAALGNPPGPGVVTLYFPKGVYMTTQGLPLPSYSVLTGDAANDTTIGVFPAAGPSENPLKGGYVPGTNKYSVIYNKNGKNANVDIAVQNITVRGGGTAPMHGYQCRGYDEDVLENGITFINVTSPTVTNSRVFDVTGSGIVVNGDQKTPTSMVITGNVVNPSNSSATATINDAGYGILAAGVGVHALGAQGAGGIIANNVIGSGLTSTNMDDGLHCNGCTGVLIAGNQISFVNGDAIGNGEGSSYITITSNTIINPGHRGIAAYVPQAEQNYPDSYITIAYNRIKRTAQAEGIHVMSSTDPWGIENHITILQNYVNGTGTGEPKTGEESIPPSCKVGNQPPPASYLSGIVMNGDTILAVSNAVNGTWESGPSINPDTTGVVLNTCTNCAATCNNSYNNNIGLSVGAGGNPESAIVNNLLTNDMKACKGDNQVCNSQGNGPVPSPSCFYLQP